jgi:hypothetical protein
MFEYFRIAAISYVAISRALRPVSAETLETG